MQHPTLDDVSPTLRRDCINRPLPSSTCLLDQRHFSIHTHTHTHARTQNYFWRSSFQSSSVSIETFNEGEANKTAALPWLSTAPRNNRYHYHSARRTIWTGSHGQLQGRALGMGLVSAIKIHAEVVNLRPRLAYRGGCDTYSSIHNKMGEMAPPTYF